MRNVFPEYKSDVILGNGELQLDPMSYNVFYKKREINLSPREFEVLYLLAQRPNWVIPKKNIVFCQALFPKKSVGIPFFQQGIFPVSSGHYVSLRMRACSIR